MKSTAFPFPQIFAILIACWCSFLLLPQTGRAQYTELYGTSTGEYFIKAIPGAQGIYVLGLENGMIATVTYTDLTGTWQWTHRMGFTSAWFDGIIDPSSGNLLTVGSTLPLGNSNQSLIGEFNTSGFLCAKSLEEPGLEILSRLTDNFDGTFSAVGLHTTPTTQFDVVIFNLSPNCTVNFKKRFFSQANDEFYNDILTMGSAGADFLVAGKAGNNAIIYRMSSSGAFVGGAQGPVQYDYADLEYAAGDILAAANPTGGGQPHIMRFDNSLIPKWEISVNGVSSLQRVVFAPNGDIFAVGTANVNGLTRAVVLKIDDSSGTPVLAWPGVAKYFENGETSYTGGHISLAPNGDVAFADGRDGNPGSFGGTDAFLALTDGDLNSTCTLETMASITLENTLFDGPAEIELLFYDVPQEQFTEGPMIDYGQTFACGDPDAFPGFKCGQAVVTCFSGFNSPANYFSGVNQNAPVVALIDVRDQSAATQGTWWTQASAGEYSHPLWTPQNIGQVFGIAIDKSDDVFVAASSIYTCETFSPNPYNYDPFTTAGGPGAIYRLDNTTGVPSLYISTGAFTPGGTTIPNSGSALGDIGYDEDHDQFFVTNHADGMIYRIKNGVVMSRFDPFGNINPPASGPGSDPDFVDMSQRTWGVAYSKKYQRVYFATWKEDKGRPSNTLDNEIWSIPIDGTTGEFMTTYNSTLTRFETGEQLEISIPKITWSGCTWSNPVSDIAFAENGRMLLAERTMTTDCGGAFSSQWYDYAHYSRLLEYEYNVGTSTWDVTPGHQLGPCVGNVGLKYQVGETNNQGSNSAGGCDYGYDSFDPTVVSQPDCDKFVWVTGDNLHPPATFNSHCSTPGTVWLYGMQGMSATTNGSMYSSLLIDFDNNVCSHDKILMGDVEIFKCGCIMPNPDFPCDSLWVTKDSVIFDPGVPGADTCCWDIDFHINAGPVAYLEVESITSGVIFNNPSLSSSFNWDSSTPPTGTLLTIVSSSPGHGIPQGTYNDGLNFCLGNILTPAQDTQCVVFRWYAFGPTDIPYLACTDTCYFYCPPPVFGDTCLVVKNDSVSCDPAKPLEYCYFFQVQNLSDFTANQVILSNPTPGFEFKPCPPPSIIPTFPTIALPNPPLNPGIEPDSCSPQLCVKIVANSPVTSPTTVCFNTGLSSSDSCCHSPVEHCIVLEPCCDPCEERGFAVHNLPPADSCCHSIDITNGCNFGFFTKLELESITPGVCFGSHWTGGPSPGDWSNPFSSPTVIQWQHLSGSVPNGTIPNLLNFCLDKIDQPSEVPQMVVLKWITLGANGQDSVACTDTLVFDCEIQDFDCIEVLSDSIACAKDADGNLYYQYTMTFKNASQPQHFATELIFNQIGGPPLVVFPNPVNFYPPGANLCDITTITTDFYPLGTVSPGDKLSFTISLNDRLHPDDWCCFEGDTLCVFVPECDTCICQPNLTLSQSGVDYPVFCDPHVGFIPTLPCPADDVFVGGFMGCVDATTGELCDETEVIWELAGPDTTFGGTTTNFSQFIFPKDLVDEPGLYCLTLWTICEGAFCPTMPDTCVCKVTWVREECDTCCTTLEDFCEKLDNNVSLSVDSALCKATLNIGDIGCGSYIEWVQWGPNFPQVFGPFHPGDMPMFTYPGSGTYQVCYLAIELDTNGFICLEKVVWDTISVMCDTCKCLPPENLYFVGLDSLNGGEIAVACGVQDTIMLPCEITGNEMFYFHGDARCMPDSCLSSGYHWSVYDLTPPPTGVFGGQGTFGPGGHFDIQLAYSQLTPGVLYEVVLTYFCGDEECTCGVKFMLEECDTCCTDFEEFLQDAANVQHNAQIGNCTIIANGTGLDDCMQITWDWGDGSPIEGPYSNNTVVSHTYTGTPPPPYTVCYTITEYNSVTGDSCWSAVFCVDEEIYCDTCATPPSNMVAWWPMEDQIGDLSAVDIVGSHHGMPKPNGIIGSPNGPNPAAGVVNGALHFVSPGNRHLEVPSSTALNFGAGSFSIDAWINTNMGTQTEPIVDKLGNLTSGYALSIQGTSPSNYRLTLVIGKSTGPVEVVQGPVILANDWNFVAATVSPPTVTFYVGNSNGFFQSTATINGTSNATNTRPLLIGGNPLNLHWNILIDELELFNKALSLAEVDAIWRAGSQGKCEIDDCLCGDLSTEAGAGFNLAVIDAANLIYAFQPLELIDDCDQVTWNWGDGTPSSQSSGRQVVEHMFTSNETVEVCMDVVRIDDNGETCEHSTCSDVTSTGESGEAKPFRLFPNPTSGSLNIEFYRPALPGQGLRITDLAGRTLMEARTDAGATQQILLTETLPGGLYFLQVVSEGKVLAVEKFVKQ